ncbi:MAG: hypothetical protein JO026_02230 [Patescibacteria group bacterium]|nr:hypothetical protein [Patescibacteria group bacterium]
MNLDSRKERMPITFTEPKTLLELAGSGTSVAWTGGISLAKALESGEVDKKKLDEAIAALAKYYVPADPDGSMRCIDGRVSEEAVGGYFRKRLGPQVPGGSAGTVLALQIADEERMGSNTTFVEDMDSALGWFKENDLYFGGHIDSHSAEHPENTGCGAIDKIPEILAKLESNVALLHIENVTRILLGANFDSHILPEILEEARRLNAKEEIYFEKDEEGRYAYKKKVIRALEENAVDHDPIEVLVGAHKEMVLVVNMVPETTFDRDHFSLDNGNAIQAFNYDFWRSIEMANKLYPKDAARRKEFLVCRTMLAVAALMALTDGTILATVRK